MEEPLHQIPREYLSHTARSSGILSHLHRLQRFYEEALSEPPGARSESVVAALNRVVELSERWSTAAGGAEADRSWHERYAKSIAGSARSVYAHLLNAIQDVVSSSSRSESIGRLEEALALLCATARRHAIGVLQPADEGKGEDAPPGLSLVRLLGQELSQLSALYYFYGEAEVGQLCKYFAAAAQVQTDIQARNVLPALRAFAEALHRAESEREADFRCAFLAAFESARREQERPWAPSDYPWVHGRLSAAADLFRTRLGERSNDDTVAAELLESMASHVRIAAEMLRGRGEYAEALKIVGEVLRYQFLRDSRDWWCVALFVLLFANSCECLFSSLRGSSRWSACAPTRAEVVARLRALLERLSRSREVGLLEVRELLEEAVAYSTTLLRYSVLSAFGAQLGRRGETYVVTLEDGQGGSYEALAFTAEHAQEDAHLTFRKEPLRGTPWPALGRVAELNEAFAEDCAFFAAWEYRRLAESEGRRVKGVAVLGRLSGAQRLRARIGSAKTSKVASFPERQPRGRGTEGDEGLLQWHYASEGVEWFTTRCYRYLSLSALTDEQRLWCARLDVANRAIHILRNVVNPARAADSTPEARRACKRQLVLLACAAYRTISRVFQGSSWQHFDDLGADFVPEVFSGLSEEGVDLLPHFDRLKRALSEAAKVLMTYDRMERRDTWELWERVATSCMSMHRLDPPAYAPDAIDVSSPEGHAYGCRFVPAPARSRACYNVDPFQSAGLVESNVAAAFELPRAR